MNEEYAITGRVISMNGRAILEIVVESDEEAAIISELVVASLRTTTKLAGERHGRGDH